MRLLAVQRLYGYQREIDFSRVVYCPTSSIPGLVRNLRPAPVLPKCLFVRVGGEAAEFRDAETTNAYFLALRTAAQRFL